MDEATGPAHPAYGVVRRVTATASVVLAQNPSAMTLDGTNSWVLRAPGQRSCVVVDPGPDDAPHLERLREQGPVELILLTHRHLDHAASARSFAAATGAPVRALDPELVLGAEGLAAGAVVGAAGLELRVVATPGHTDDSLSFLVEGDAAVLTGDTVLGRGTTVVEDLDAYLASLRRLAELPASTALLPGHGPDLADAAGTAREYLAHREQRLDQVRAALAELGRGPDEVEPRAVVEVVYADVDQQLWPAADRSVAAQLEYLRTRG